MRELIESKIQYLVSDDIYSIIGTRNGEIDWNLIEKE